MELFNFLRKREIGTVKPGLNPATEPQGTDASAESKGGSYQERVARIPNEDAALKVSAYYRGLELRARTMSQLVFAYHCSKFGMDTNKIGSHIRRERTTVAYLIRQDEIEYQHNAVFREKALKVANEIQQTINK